MKPIAIHYLSRGFTQRWIEYCEKNSIHYIKVNCYQSDIIDQLKNCSALLWHWNYDDYKDRQLAPFVILSAEKMGLLTIPNYNSCWHFDNKIAQKYLLESLNAPIIDSWVFYDKLSAINWLRNAKFPLVFKLKNGAGSYNVKLVENLTKANTLVKKSFKKGFRNKNYGNIIKDRFVMFLKTKQIDKLYKFIQAIYRSFVPKYDERITPREKAYVYFQQFLPDNNFDTRLIVIGNKCFGVRRYNRKNDFRASGSGILEYDPSVFDLKMVEIAFKTSRDLGSNTLALDFLFDNDENPVLAEISYAFPTGAFTDNCLGFWDEKLNWVPGKYIVQHLMIDDLLSQLKRQ